MKRIQSLLDIQEKEFEKVRAPGPLWRGSAGGCWIWPSEVAWTSWPEVCQSVRDADIRN